MQESTGNVHEFTQQTIAAPPGYRELTKAEAASVQRVRDLGRACEALLSDINREGGDGRWASIAKTHMQEGLMAATRAITKPTFF